MEKVMKVTLATPPVRKKRMAVTNYVEAYGSSSAGGEYYYCSWEIWHKQKIKKQKKWRSLSLASVKIKITFTRIKGLS